MFQKRYSLIVFCSVIAIGFIVLGSVVNQSIYRLVPEPIRMEVSSLGTIIFSQPRFDGRNLILKKGDSLIGHLRSVKDVLLNAWNPDARLETLHLKIATNQLTKLQLDRKSAIKTDILINRTKVDASIEWQGRIIPARINLKGLMRGHWATTKQWSLRVNLPKGHSIAGFTNFSVSKHHERQFPDNQLGAHVLASLGVPTPRHKTVKLYVNGINWGPMLVEEEFSSAYLELRGLKSGPIVEFGNQESWKIHGRLNLHKDITGVERFAEWQGRLDVNVLNQNDSSLPSWESLVSVAKTVHEGISQSEIMAGQLDYFLDIKAFAKSLAVAMTWGEVHSLTSHNMRFYLNPYTAQITSIPTDAYWIKELNSRTLLSAINSLQPTIFFQLFGLNRFRQEFVNALGDLSDLIDNIEEQWRVECAYFGKICLDIEKIQTLKKNYNFLTKDETLGTLFNSEADFDQHRSRSMNESNYHLSGENLNANDNVVVPLLSNHIYARAYSDGVTHLFNITYYPVHVKTIKISEPCDNGDSCGSYWIEPNIVLRPSTNQISRTILKLPVTSPEQSRVKIETNINGISRTTTLWVENESSKLSNLATIDELDVPPFFTCRDKTCFVGPGDYLCESPVILPKGYSLEIAQGTSLSFAPNGYIFLNGGQLKAIGTKSEPIYLGPSEVTWGGIYVMSDSTEISELQYTTISSASAFKHRLIELSGGVTFYNSVVHVKNSLFSRSFAEDALNVVNSTFQIENTMFQESRSDAIDSDYSSGKFSHLHITDTGGDGIDLSGTNVEIESTSLDLVHDKAVSVGEESKVTLESIDISRVGIGIAIKDGSSIEGNRVSVKDSELGDVLVYRKKLFYQGGAGVFAESQFDLDKVYVQHRSSLSVNGRRLSTVNIDVERMYQLEQMQKPITQ